MISLIFINSDRKMKTINTKDISFTLKLSKTKQSKAKQRKVNDQLSYKKTVN